MRFLSIIILCSLFNLAHAAPNPPQRCAGNAKIQKVFPSGARWDICWAVRNQEGVVLSQIYYKHPNQTARRVLGEASLSQLLTVFDDNTTRPYFMVTQQGLGGDNLQTLNRQDCPSGALRKYGNRNVLCRSTINYGHQYKYTTQRQGTFFELSSVSQLGTRSYTVAWRFYENGTIEPRLGMSGTLPRVGESTELFGWPVTASGAIAPSFTDHAFWRLDFDLGGDNSNDVAEEINSVPSTNRLLKNKKIQVVNTETGRPQNPETKRFWRIRDAVGKSTKDNGYVSYEIDPSNYSHSRSNINEQPWLDNDIYFSHYQACERFAAQNHLASPGCSFNVLNFTADNENIRQSDVVVWYKQSYHHIPRSEEDNLIPTVWNSFKLQPRDWHSKNPF